MRWFAAKTNSLASPELHNELFASLEETKNY